MSTLPAFPKPGQVKKAPEAVRVMKDGREVCNLTTKAGRDEYARRKRVMWERQGKKCSIQGPKCTGIKHLSISEATFEHDEGRGHGGGHRDDRIEVDGKPLNSVACPWCNSMKGSIRKSILDGMVP
jgi:hypothetical protein